MRESHTALEVAVRLRYLRPLSAELEQRCQRILATLQELSFSRAGGSVKQASAPGIALGALAS